MSDRRTGCTNDVGWWVANSDDLAFGPCKQLGESGAPVDLAVRQKVVLISCMEDDAFECLQVIVEKVCELLRNATKEILDTKYILELLKGCELGHEWRHGRHYTNPHILANLVLQ